MSCILREQHSQERRYTNSLCMESGDEVSDDVGKLRELLRYESRCREETGQNYDTLQREYDELLKKFAEAENTIDKLRIGAKIKLCYEKPKEQQAEYNVLKQPRSKSVQLIHLPQPQKGVLSHAYSMPEQEFASDIQNDNERVFSEDNNNNNNNNDLASTLQFLQDDIVTFQTSIAEGEHTLEKQQLIFEQLQDRHNKIKDELNLSDTEEDRNRSESFNSRSTNGPNSLHAEVYRLGLRLDEINEEIVEQLRSKERNSTDSEGKSTDRIDGESLENGDLDKLGIKKTSETGVLRAESEKEGYVARPTGVSFEDKYLSQSLDVPIDKSTVCSIETNEKVGSWLSHDHHFNPSPRRRVQSEIPLRSRIHRDDQARSHDHHKSLNQSKLSSPDTIGKTFTMNSTEDSGFLDGNSKGKRDQTSHFRSLTSPDTSRDDRNDYRPDLLPSGELLGPVKRRSLSQGEEYRDRLNSLRNFIHHRRDENSNKLQQNNKTKKKTPRSWVRGKMLSPDNEHPSQMSQSSNRKQPSQSDARADRLVYERSPPSENDQTMESRHSSRTKNSRKTSVTQRKEEEMLGALQEEMQGIRDLVLDLKSSLRSNILDQPVPDRLFLSDKQAPSTYSNVKETDRTPHIDHKKNFQRKTAKLQERDRNPTKTDLQHQQFRTLERMNVTMDHLSKKLKSMDKTKEKERQNSWNSSSSESEGEQSNLNTMNKPPKQDKGRIDEEYKQVILLQNLNNRVDGLYEKLKKTSTREKRRTRLSTDKKEKKTMQEKSRLPTTEQSRIFSSMQEKLNEIEKNLSYKTANTKAPVKTKPACTYTRAPCSDCEDGRKSSHRDERKSYTSANRQPSDTPRDRMIRNSTPASVLLPAHYPVNTYSTISSPNVIHHYHSFCVNDGEQGQIQRRSQDGILRHHHQFLPNVSAIPHEATPCNMGKRAPDPLYDSIESAQLAARQMENLSKKMLSTIAADLFNTRDAHEY